MKTKIISILLLIALLASTAAAETQNKDLPTQDQLIDFLKTVPTGDNYTKVASELSLVEHPSWKWDIWATNSTKLISFYYTDPASKKGYGSTYLSDMGFVQNKLCYVNMTLICGYNGTEEVQVVENVTEPVENTTSDEIIPDVITTKNATVPEVIEVINNTTASLPSEIAIYAKNATSGDTAQFKTEVNGKPTEETRGYYEEILHNLLNAIFGGE